MNPKKIIILAMWVLSGFGHSALASPQILDACEVKLERAEATIQNGIVYSYDQATAGTLIIYGPKDPKRICDETDRVVLKELPIHFSGTNAIGLTIVGMIGNLDQSISVHAWDGNSLSDIMGYYAGLRVGLAMFGGAQGMIMNKMNFWNTEISLTSTAWNVFGLKADLSIPEVNIRASEPSDPEWSIVLHSHD